MPGYQAEAAIGCLDIKARPAGTSIWLIPTTDPSLISPASGILPACFAALRITLLVAAPHVAGHSLFNQPVARILAQCKLDIPGLKPGFSRLNWISTIAPIWLRLRRWKSNIASSRFKNSGRKASYTSSSPFLWHHRPGGHLPGPIKARSQGWRSAISWYF